MNTIINGSLNLLLRLKFLWIHFSLWKPLLRMSQNPGVAQEVLLMKILDKNKNTNFGKKHGFSSITSHQEFIDRIPVQTYEDLRPYIESEQPEEGTPKPVIYAQTSGTTGKPKNIPIFPETVKRYKRSQHVFAYAEYRGIPGVYDGKILGISGPAIEGYRETGIPYGSVSGLVYRSMPAFMRKKYVIPPEIFEIESYQRKYYLLSLFALAEKNITLIAAANPSTLLKIYDVIREYWEDLLREIKSGNEDGLKPNPSRAAELRNIPPEGKASFVLFWPNLKSITTWTGGTCSVLIPALKKLAPSVKIVEMGYLSTEFRGSITLDVVNNRSMPTLHENFFEFVECPDWENNSPKFLTLAELEEKKRYYIFVTTPDGLYRYFINDIIETDGFFHRTHAIRFIQKGKGVTSLTGEKLYESQVVEAMLKVKEEQNLDFDFFMMIASREKFRYLLYIESAPFEGLVDRFEELLGKLNIEFKAKRESERLGKTEVFFLKEQTYEKYKSHCLKEGQREGQFKLVKLHEEKDFTFDFKPHTRG